MSRKAKIIFLSFTVIVPFLIYCIIYYTPIIRNSSFKAAEFVSLEIKWLGNELVNSYDSATGRYEYLNAKDSLVVTNVKLKLNDIIFIHSKANELGFWNLPEVIANHDTDVNTSKRLRYFMKMNYKKKSKSVLYFTDYNELPKLRDVAEQMQKLLIRSVNDAEERYNQ